ncbi:hypothetical protein AKUH3B209X_PPKS00100 (plasmid) [Apilactobacillus kunkeei]|uniref:helix-turn-helix domain-containing protein n=1 Tax=Apilactobacillus waqarii TaxID=2851006 RepID=UPI0021E3E190|nr:hypothetical protein AKUH4B403J_PPKS00100 [Apilactobacillus kunkeei]CAI2672452.1 hypothetical protein AKUH4B103J_PPKS00100 [Apilactobacillus kunkeei]CAI2673169.1 hypothetical protein AKUH4B203M_PPKS00100 [Apilactobacillus kunkeei]CAI2674835.1 hypothetical protein AKUH4B116J_PPKS00100 [Apilactobacillus kunkeei]CAI2675153.1 hypothetical protein AKUH4B303J_PPKS00100 [Apilactobacillus kunkeei]
MRLGQRLKNLRKQNNLTQFQLAEITFYSCQTISKWERDLCCPPIEALDIISKKLHIDISYFFETSHNKNLDNKIIKDSIKTLDVENNLSINNLSNHSNVEKTTIQALFKNDDDLINFFMDTIDRKIRNDIVDKICMYSDLKIFLNEVVINTLYNNREVLHIIYKSNLRLAWFSFISDNYINAYKHHFYKGKKDPTDIKILIILNCFSRWLSNNEVVSLEKAKKDINKMLSQTLIEFI